VNAALGAESGVIGPSGSQSYGTIAPGQSVSRPFTFTVGANPGEAIRAALTLTSDSGSQPRAVFKLPAGRHPPAPRRHTRTDLITIPARGTIGYTSVIPNFITVFPFGLPTGTSPVVTKVTVTLHGFTHQRTTDVDALLVHASSRRSVMLISDAGAGSATNLDLTFADSATQPLTNAPLTSGTYRPKNLGSLIDVFPGGPLKPYGNSLSIFNGLSPLDQWVLYIRDDQTGSVGTIAGWDLTIDYAY
jgi:hypothetical protein